MDVVQKLIRKVGGTCALDLFGNDQLIELNLGRLLLVPRYVYQYGMRIGVDVHEFAGHD